MAAFPSGTALRVVYDFAASALGELSVSSEDQVVVVDAEQDSGGGSDSRSGWIRVVNRSLGPANGEVGYVPVEYVIEESKYYDGSSTTPVPERVVTGVATVAAASVDIATPAKDAIASESAATTIAPVSNMASPNDADSEDGAGLVRPPSPQHTNEVAVGTRVVVRYAYAAEKADELELKVDDIVHVVASPEGGWWKGMSGQGKLTRVGWFPSNMTEVLPESQQQLTNDDASSVNSTPDTGRASKRTSWFKKRPSSVLSVNRSEDSNSARSRSTSLDVNFGSAQSSAKSAEEPTPSSNRTSFYMFKGESKRRNTDGASRDDLDGQRSALIDELLRPFPITSWKDKADAGEVERMSATERKRQEVIWELVSTERDYYRDMRIVVEIFMKPAVQKKIFTTKQLESIFGNAEDITKLSLEFLDALESKYKLNPIVESIGQTFLDMSEKFFVYTTYCADRQNGLARLQQLTSSNKTVRQFLDECYKSNVTRNLDLGSFLIKPPQRICKYPLLIKEALKNTATDHSDRAPLEAAMVKIQHIMTIINQGTPVTDLAKRAQEIQDSFTEKITLVAPSRYLVREDSVYFLHGDTKKPRRMFLFNDLVVFARKDWRDKHHLIDQAPLSDIRLSDVRSKNQNSHLFEIEIPQPSDGPIPVAPSRYVVSVPTKAVKSAWMDAVKALINITISSKEFKPELLTQSTKVAESDTEDEAADPGMLNTQDVNQMATISDEESSLIGSDSTSPSFKRRSFPPSQAMVITVTNPTTDVPASTTDLAMTATSSSADSQSLHARSFTELREKITSASAKNLLGGSASRLSETSSSQLALDSMAKVTINTLRDRIKEQEQTIRGHVVDIERLTANLKDMERKTAEVTASGGKLKQTMLTLNEEKENLQRANDALKTDVATHRKTIEELKIQVQSALSDRTNKHDLVDRERAILEARFESERQELRRQFDRDLGLMRSQMEQSSRSFTRNIDDLQQALSKRDEQLAKLEQEKLEAATRASQEAAKGNMVTHTMEQVQKRLVDAQTTAKTFQETIHRLEAEKLEIESAATLERNKAIAKVESKTAELRKEMENQTAQMTRYESTIERLESDAEQLNLKLFHANQSVEDVTVEKKQLLQQLGEAKGAVKQKDAAITALKSSQRQLKHTVERYNDNIVDAEKSIAELKDQNEKTRAANKSLQSTVARLDAQILQLQTNLESVMLELTNAAQAYEMLEERHEKAQGEIIEFQQMESSYLTLQQDHASLTESHRQLEDVDIPALREEIDDLDTELALSKKTVRETQDALDESRTLYANTAKELDRAMAQVQDSQANFSHRNNEYDELSQLQRETASSLQNAHTNIAKLEAEKAELERETVELKHKMRAAAVLKKRWKDAEEQVEHLKSQLTTAAVEIAQKNEAMNGLQQQLQVANEIGQARALELRRTEEILNRNVQLLEAEVQKTRERAHDLEGVVMQRVREIDQLLVVLNAIGRGFQMPGTGREFTQDQITAIADAVAHLHTAKESLDDELRALQSRHALLDDRCKSMESDLVQAHQLRTADSESHAAELRKMSARFEQLTSDMQTAHAAEVQRWKDMHDQESHKLCSAHETETTRLQEQISKLTVATESLKDENQRLLRQVQELMSSDVERKEVQMWVEKHDALREKYAAAQKQFVAAQAEIGDLTEQLDAAVMEMNTHEENMMLKKVELRHANETIQGLRTRITSLAEENAGQQAFVQRTHGKSSYDQYLETTEEKRKLEQENERLYGQVMSLQGKLAVLQQHSDDVSRTSQNRQSDNPHASQQQRFDTSVDDALSGVHDNRKASATRPLSSAQQLPEVHVADEALRRKEGVIYRKVQTALGELGQLVQQHNQYERDMMAAVGECAAASTLQFMNLSAHLETLSIRSAGHFDQTVMSLRGELNAVAGAVKDMVIEYARYDMHRNGEQALLVGELKASNTSIRELRNKNNQLMEELLKVQSSIAEPAPRPEQHPSGTETRWSDTDAKEIREDWPAVLGQVLSVFDDLIRSDAFVRDKALRLKDSQRSDDRQQLLEVTPDRFKDQLRLTRALLQAITLQMTTNGLRLSDRREQRTNKRHAASMPGILGQNGDDGAEPLDHDYDSSYADLQRQLSLAKISIERLRAQLQEANAERERVQKQGETHGTELKRLQTDFQSLKGMVRVKDEELVRVSNLLELREREMNEISHEKSNISQVVLQACSELEELVVQRD